MIASRTNRPNGRAVPVRCVQVMASSFDKLPAEVLFSILQLLPAKDLCRLRAVCKSWRSLTIDPTFIKSHADGHSNEPLFIAKFRDNDTHVSIVDLSGNVVKRIAGANGGHQVQRTRLDLACLATVTLPNTCRILSPATGRIHIIPRIRVTGLSFVNGMLTMCRHDPCAFFILGFVGSTGEYKLLRIHLQVDLARGARGVGGLLYMVEVLTINGGALWRRRAGPEFGVVDKRSGVAFDGVVYFLSYDMLNPGGPYGINNAGMSVYRVLSFDLGREEWRRDLIGPSGITSMVTWNILQSQLTLTDLKGSLVLAHHPRYIMDLWLLRDFESGLWVKEYNIITESITSSLAVKYKLIPLLELDHGRLLIHLAPTGLLFICHPGTNTFTRVDMRHSIDSISVYTGSPLSLQEGGMV